MRLLIFFSLLTMIYSQTVLAISPKNLIYSLDDEVEINKDQIIRLWSNNKNETKLNAGKITKDNKVKASYKLFHTPKYLNLILKIENKNQTNPLQVRDRGYQNGDGFHLVLAKPQVGNTESKKFSVLAFSYTEKENQWGEKTYWYRDVDLLFLELKKTIFKTFADKNSTFFYVAIPWEEIHDFRPYLDKEYGFNLCYVEAYDKTSKNFHCLLEDERIQWEQSPRKYIVHKVELPKENNLDAAFQKINDKILKVESLVKLNVAGYLKKENVLDVTLIVNGKTQKIDKKFTPGKFEFQVDINKDLLQINENSIISTIKINNKILSHQEYKIFRYSDSKINDFNNKISSMKLNTEYRKGDIETLDFLYSQIKTSLESGLPYKSVSELTKAFSNLEASFLDLEKNKSLYMNSKSIVQRRAFLSTIDNTLQPYSLRLPANFNEKSNSSLIVFLHGSGSDDTNIQYFKELHKLADKFNAIILAPFGRGTSNAYSADYGNKDVLEAIQDIQKYYSINSKKIVLSGYSMGGYGTYRVNFDNKDLFSGLMIFAGHPSLGVAWGEPSSDSVPDFMEDKYIKSLQEKKIFIFHGDKDRNCPIEITEKFISKLKDLKIDVTSLIKEGIGHETPNEKDMQTVENWLKEKNIL